MSVYLRSCLSYSACKLILFYTSLCYHMWLVCFYRIFPHYFSNGMILEKKIKRLAPELFFLNFSSPCI